MSETSRIFQRNKALGYVSNHVPLVARYIKLRKENLIVTCVGKSFHTYGCTHFTLLSVSGHHDEDIRCLAADSFLVFTASGNTIYAWRRGTELKHTYTGHTAPVTIILPYGPHLVTVDEGSALKLWDIKTEELQAELSFGGDVFQVTALMHPATYLNKVLLGSEQGSLELWNLKTCTRVFVFPGWGIPVTVLEQAPAINVVAIGTASGKIVLHNLKFDQTLMELSQDWGAVTSLSFRTDNHPVLVSGSITGALVFWDLEHRKVFSQIQAAHSKAVTGLQCLPNEPLLVTSSPDNSLKMWIFDMLDGGAREGHTAPPTCIKFHGADGHNLLSTGGDCTLRIFSTITETFNKSLGRASYNRNLSRKKAIAQLASESTRGKQWADTAAIHHGIPIVTTWSYDKLKMGDVKLVPERFSHSNKNNYGRVSATCICITHCGNFVVIGYTTGHVDRFNIQSGLHRGNYGSPLAHNGPVRGVATDGLNQVTITGGSDCLVKFWSFKPPGKTPISILRLEEPVNMFCSHRESSMLAVALQDYTVVVVDIDIRSVVRKFLGHSGQVTTMDFSPDSRWLITASMDCTIRTWDIPSAQLIDCFQMESPCVSLSMSPTGALLATAHVDCLGLFLWSNKTLYSHISLRPILQQEDIPTMGLPIPLGEEAELPRDSDQEDTDMQYQSPAQISQQLVTLSTLPSSRWHNLLHLDTIKMRNKPKDAPKAPKAAPFFLPTIPSLELRFELGQANKPGGQIRDRSSVDIHSFTVFGKLLNQSRETGNFAPAIDKFLSLGPSALDFEVNSLSMEGGGSLELMLQYLKLVKFMLDSNNNFELAQSYLGLFLKTHGDTIASQPVLREYLKTLESSQLAGWFSLQRMLLYSLCVVQAIRNI
uniref:WD repeat domain 36 n=1 Tax=Timema genevievae TaxID=629358 RepID=A0A7R9K3U1_TIMGE|nr:unnamed protein product [Timema genevievae]